jgi:dihydrofolate reductase
MRKIKAALFMSLDGVVESPDKWHLQYFNDEMGRVVGSLMGASDTMLLGRVTYQEFAAHWPTSDDEGAEYMNTVPKIVVSTTLEKAEWGNATVIGTDVAERLTELKQQPGQDLSVTGSPTLVRSLLRTGVLDELHLLIHPVIVGAGRRLFEPDGGQQQLELTRSEVFSTGVVYLTYQPA